MSALLFLAGFEGGTQPKEVTKYISDAFKKNKVLQLWVDPDSKARAVALLKKEIGAEKIEELGREFKLHDKFILTEPTEPVKSVVVKHKKDEELCYGMQDKLKYLFSSQRHTGRTVNKVKQLSSVSWEVYFMDGWEAVLQACSQSWEEQKLEVIPYFECFKEDIEEQLKRIPSQDEKKKEGKHDKGTTKDKQQQPGKKSHGSSSKGVWDLQKSALQPLPKPETSSTDESDQEMEVDMASHDEEASPHTSSVGRKQKKDSLKESEAGKQIKVSKVVFHHDFVWRFLIMLQFEKTVTGMFPKLKIESVDGEAVIKGEDGSVKTVEETLQQANLKVTKQFGRHLHQDKQIRQDLLCECDEFLSRTGIQKELKEHTGEEGLSIILHEADGKFSVMITNDKDSKKVSFPEFVSSQINVKECLLLPDEKFEDEPKWLNFVASLNKNYPCIHISVINKSVFLLWLTCRSEGSDTVAKEITKFIENLDATRKKSKTTVSIGGLSPFFVWVLDTLQIKEAAKNVKRNFSVCIEEEDINVSGYTEDVGALKTLLRAINKKILLSEDQEEFLSSETVQQYLKQFLASVKLHIETSPNLQVGKNQNMSITVVLEDDTKKDLEAFIKSLARREKCGSLPQGLNHNERQEWQTLTQDVHRKHPFLKVFVEDDKVTVLTVEMLDYSKSEKVIEKINGFIKSKTAMSSEKSSDTERMLASRQQSSHPVDLHRNLYHANVVKSFSFPGLVPFFDSPDGQHLRQQLGDRHSCFISYENDMSQSRMQLEKQEATEDSAGLQYKVAMLATARGRDFNIHQIQGEMHDLNVMMKITLQTSSTISDCEIRSQRSSRELTVVLPPWQAPNDNHYHEYFEKLRNSWRINCVRLMLQQAEHLGWPSMAISTKGVLNAEYPFPADVIAQAITEELLMMFNTSDSSYGASRNMETFDMYICEPEKETIFNAFSFHLKKNLIFFGPPDQESWDKICFEEPCSFKDSKERYNVEVTDTYTRFEKRDTVFCYPIHSSLDLKAFPAFKEMPFLEWKLKPNIYELQKHYGGDGPVDGEIIPLPLLGDRMECVVCCPEWGMDCQKVIADALKIFLSKAESSDIVRIVPPGMHVPPWYPKQFLAQTFFRELDKLLRNNRKWKEKRIVIAVHDSDYRKAFNMELQKRKPKQKEGGIKSTIMNFFGFEETATQGKGGSRTTVVKSTVPCTTVIFSSATKDDSETAARDLDKELTKLMEQNKETQWLIGKQGQNFMDNMKGAKNMGVQIIVENQYKKETSQGSGQKNKKGKKGGKKKKNQKKDNKDNNTDAQEGDKLVLAGSTVTVQGLIKEFVKGVMSMAVAQLSPDDYGATGGTEAYSHNDTSDEEE